MQIKTKDYNKGDFCVFGTEANPLLAGTGGIDVRQESDFGGMYQKYFIDSLGTVNINQDDVGDNAWKATEWGSPTVPIKGSYINVDSRTKGSFQSSKFYLD